MSSDLIAWLREQIAEDEEAARKRMHHAQENHLLLQDPKYLGRLIPGWHEWPEIEAAAAHALAQCEAHTALLNRYERAVAATPSSVSSYLRGQDHGYREACLDAIRDAAAALADRPGYREEWRP